MDSLTPVPGTPDRPAQPGAAVALLSEPLLPGAFPTSPTVELSVPGEAEPRSLPIAAPPTASVIITTLPGDVTAADNPFTIRVKPLTGASIEAPLFLGQLVATPGPQELVDDIASKLRLLAQVDGQMVATGPIAVQPSQQPLPLKIAPLPGSPFQVLSAPAPGRARPLQAAAPDRVPSLPRPGAGPFGRPGRPVPRAGTASAVGGIGLGSLPLDLATQLAGASLTVEVTLTVAGPGGDVLPDDEVELEIDATSAAFTLLAAPAFVEQRVAAPELGDPAARSLTLQASAVVTARLPGGQQIISPPTPLPALELQLMPLQLPTMLALFRHSDYRATDETVQLEGRRQGFVLIVVPEGSPVPGAPRDLHELLRNDLVGAPLGLSGLATRLKRLKALEPALARLEALIAKVAAQTRFGVAKGNQSNLNLITMWDRDGAIFNDIEANNEASSIMLLGLPSARAELFCSRNHDGGQGSLTITLTQPAGSALTLPRLAAIPKLPEKPALSFAGVGALTGQDATLAIVDRPRGKDFDNAISSLKLIP